jgi:hypothetical protein
MRDAAQRLRVLRPVAPAERFSIVPYDAARAEWRTLTDRDPRAHLYHRERWLKILSHAYGFRLLVAELRSRAELVAACVMAQTKNPLVRGLVALPFSDDCAPLAADEESNAALLSALATNRPAASIEIRGADAAPPWSTADSFLLWELSLLRPIARIFAGLSTNFRRNLRRARGARVAIEPGNTRDHLARFIALHAASRRRQGIPCQPKRFFETVLEVYRDDASIWCASHSGRDLAAVFVLRDGGRIYYKWSARGSLDTLGAGHLIVWSIIEEFACRAASLDLGRADRRNEGLNRFKREVGAAATPLPYSYLPRVPRHQSAEVPAGLGRVATRLWRHLPRPVCRLIEGAIYPYLA